MTRPTRALDASLRIVIAAGLATDAYVHAKLAGDFDAIHRTISQGDLFRVEATVASLVALLVLVLPRWRASMYAAAAAVAAAGLGAVLLYRYVDVGAFGPLPNMYEPVWYPDKTWSAIGEAVALGAAVIAFAVAWRHRPRASRPQPH